MDLNYLFHRHQVSLYKADNAACREARLAHAELAEAYAARICEARGLLLEPLA